jgi:glutathione peroxidase
MSVYPFEAPRLRGETQSISTYEGKVLLIVNTASKCGLTPQYKGLQSLYERLEGESFEILGFPSNQFGGQAPGEADDIASFCQVNYGVTFPMFDKIDVNGGDTHPLFEHLKSEAPGLLGSKTVKWNFTKFLVDSKGVVVRRYAPKALPEAIESDIRELL